MATSGSVQTSNSNGVRDVIFKWELQSQSVANNTSTLSWSLVGASNGSSGYYYSGPFNVTLKDANNTTHTLVNNVYPSGSRIELRDGTVVKSGTVTITHNSTGVGTFSVTVTASVYVAASTNNCTATASFTPTAIPRASVFKDLASSYTVGTAATINITRYLSGAYYAFSYKVGSGSRVNNYITNNNTSFSWNFEAVANAIPNATSTTVTFYLKTFSDSALTKQVGDEQSATVTVNVPNYSLNTPSIAVAEGNTKNTSGVYVKNISTPKWTITASGKYGSSIQQYKVNISGVDYTSSSKTVTTAVSTSGTVKATFTVTDSRGKTGTTTYNLAVKDYTEPKMTASFVRSSTTPTTIVTTITCSVTSVQNGTTEKNTMAVKIQYGTSTSYGTTKTVQSAAISPLSLSNNKTNITSLVEATAYFFKATVTDAFGNTSEYANRVPGNSSFIDIQTGKIGIGRYARSSYSLDVVGAGYFSGSITAEQNIGAVISSETAISVFSRNSKGQADLHVAASGNRGIYLPAANGIDAHWLIYEDTSGNVTVKGGMSTSGNQTINGVKTFTSSVVAPAIELSYSTPYIDFHYGKSTENYTSRIIESASGKIDIKAPNGILFNAGALPIGNGGTGATSAANARSNLGVNQPASLSSVSIAGNATGTLSVTTANYKFYLFKFTCNSRITTIFTTYSQLSTSGQYYWIYDGSSSGAEVIITRTASSITVKRDGSIACSVVLTYWN